MVKLQPTRAGPMIIYPSAVHNTTPFLLTIDMSLFA